MIKHKAKVGQRRRTLYFSKQNREQKIIFNLFTLVHPAGDLRFLWLKDALTALSEITRHRHSLNNYHSLISFTQGVGLINNTLKMCVETFIVKIYSKAYNEHISLFTHPSKILKIFVPFCDNLNGLIWAINFYIIFWEEVK